MVSPDQYRTEIEPVSSYKITLTIYNVVRSPPPVGPMWVLVTKALLWSPSLIYLSCKIQF